MAYTEFSSDNFYIKWRNLIVLFHFANRQVFLPYSVYATPEIINQTHELNLEEPSGFPLNQ